MTLKAFWKAKLVVSFLFEAIHNDVILHCDVIRLTLHGGIVPIFISALEDVGS
jgi:hypothetical protein